MPTTLTENSSDGHSFAYHTARTMMTDGLVALSFANVCLAGAWFPILYDNDRGYFNKFRLDSSNLLALLTNLVGLSFLAWFAMQIRRHFRNPLGHFVLHLAFFSTFLIPLDFCRQYMFKLSGTTVIANLTRHYGAAVALLLLVVALWQNRRVAHALVVGVGILTPLALFNATKIFLLLLGVEHLAQYAATPSLAPLFQLQPDGPRVIWIIFDELDQRLAFEQRSPNLRLPEFDRFRAESLSATNAFAPGDSTRLSMPGLISGHLLSDVHPTSASELKVTLANNGAETNLSELPSVFRAARNLGFNTALVGWYHPYDRLFGRDLNYCAWFAFPMYDPVSAPTFTQALSRQIACIAGLLNQRRLFIDICRNGLSASEEIVTNTAYRLTFLHLAPPHKPWVYVPTKDTFTVFGSARPPGYLSNLILADNYLGQLRRAMEAHGLWDRTWVIVTTDHSWRESQRYDGKRDLHVPFLIKIAGSNLPVVYPQQVNTVLTYDLVLSVLRGQISGQQELAKWLDAHRIREATVHDTEPD